MLGSYPYVHKYLRSSLLYMCISEPSGWRHTGEDSAGQEIRSDWSS
jgi:hypothetical protein